MYKTKKFRTRTRTEIGNHLEDLGRLRRGPVHRVFLADGDSLAVETERLLEMMAEVRRCFPEVRRFGIYGSVFSLADKTTAALTALREAGLRVIYLGIESGDEEVLRRMDKYMPVKEMEAHCRKAGPAGLNLSVMVIVGLGGRERSHPHVEASAALVNRIAPSHTSLLNLMLDHTPLRRDPAYSDFTLSDYFREVRRFVEMIACRTIFRANHASNPVALEGVLPRDRERLLAEVDHWSARCPADTPGFASPGVEG